MLRFDADLLVPGAGDPIADGSVVLDGDRITYAGPTLDAPATPDAQVLRVPTVLPGLWDCHTHLVGVRSFDLTMALQESPIRRAARATGDLAAALDAGVTSIRDAGGLALDIAPAVADGSVVGPTIHAAGAILSTTGGHGDLHALSLDVVHALVEQEPMLRLCDGVDECVRAVREQLRRGAAVIKICASGGVLSEIDDPIHQQFSLDEMRAIVETAALSERSVMAHCHGKPGMLAAIEAGVRTVEHGSYLDEEVAAAMVERDVTLVPTLLIVAELEAAGRSSGMSEANARKLTAIAQRHREAVAIAHQAGVRIAMGTDVAVSGRDLPAAWGNHARELGLLVAAGLSPLEAIASATANAPATLGAQAPASGQLTVGYDADVIAVDGDPTTDVGLLADPARVTHVVARGQLVKTPPRTAA